MPGRFDVTVSTALTPAQAWDAVTDWPAHGRHVPLTTVRVTRDAGGLGDEFVGRTGVSRLGFDDPMRVTGWTPPGPGRPGRCDITKLGRVVTGWARIEVTEAPPTGRPTRSPRLHGTTSVRWVEEVGLGPAWLGRLVSPAVRVLGGLGFSRVLRRLLADAERDAPGAP